MVVQEAENHQKLSEAQDRREAIEGLKRGLESMKRNAGKPAEKFFREFSLRKAFQNDGMKKSKTSKHIKVERPPRATGSKEEAHCTASLGAVARAVLRFS